MSANDAFRIGARLSELRDRTELWQSAFYDAT